MVQKRKQPLHKFSVLSLAAMLLILCGACDIVGGSEVSEEERNNVLNVISWNLYYAQVEDLEGFMRTIHEESPARANTRASIQMRFEDFDLTYQLVYYEILSITDESAEIRVTQDTRKVDGDLPFRDTRFTFVHQLKKNHEGRWKIFSSETEKVEYLN